MLEEKLSPFTVVGIELYVDKGKPVKCKGKIAWVKDVFNPIAREAMLYDTGIKFIEMDEFDKVYLKRIIEACKTQGKQEQK